MAVGLGFKFVVGWVGPGVEVCSAEHARRGNIVSRMKNKLPIRLRRYFMRYSLLGRGTLRLPYLVRIYVYNYDSAAAVFSILEQMSYNGVV